MKIPLSWLQLTHEKTRLLVAIAGITFADMLMFMQLGFREALFDSSVKLQKNLQADIVIFNSQSETFVKLKQFSQRRLYEARGVPGVKSVTPMYISFAFWKNPVEKTSKNILVIGYNPEKNVVNLPGVNEKKDVLKQQDVVLYDQQSREEFGPVAEWINAGKTVTTEVADRKIKVGGLFSLGTSFGADGNLITSDVNFFRLFSERDRGLIDLGLIQLEKDADVKSVIQEIKKEIAADDVKVMTKAEFIEFEKNYWNSSTSIGFVFALGTTMGFIVGTVIVYQILYTDVSDHLPEYATLKAMGYTDQYLLLVVFQEAIILAIIGFMPGIVVAMFMYSNAAKATGLPIIMTVSRAIMVLILTIIMCVVSGTIAVSKLRAADPADIF
ncbi:ABC transporter permease DevC [Gloeothece verrucosa]|uniref:DevC protein n=1 Tax=Gloeothece verrucosa (strain PCC 7822) TaxID=497965 RepID=E0UDX9_GLOV7|nr:ABC transporter permease DevC [Gloeothece verrucosa]ADN12983.1 DevC protein [Gloeothece verrucosa PCC 7822]